jgi:hypothetical protein
MRYRLLVGLPLGALLFLVGGIAWQPPVPKCSGCAVLAQPFGGCNEAVQGGWICP